MPLFWKPYKSEFNQFLDELKKRDPAIEEGQQAGRALLWDRKIDRDLQVEFDQSQVQQQPYVYQTRSQ